MLLLTSTMGTDFNPHSRTESDWNHDPVRAGFGISIHTLARRATDELTSSLNNYMISIHTLARRATVGEYPLLIP